VVPFGSRTVLKAGARLTEVVWISRSSTPKRFEKSTILRATAEFWSSAAVGEEALFETPTCTVT
jgi:hypothetical protein